MTRGEFVLPPREFRRKHPSGDAEEAERDVVENRYCIFVNTD
jgi:hypothetical protein